MIKARQGYTIQEMVQLTGLSAHTLRYYERAGLISQPVERSESSGYRAYTQQHLLSIEFIKRLRATGMPIREIHHYIQLIRAGEATHYERMMLLKRHRDQVEASIEEAHQHLAALNEKLACYEENYPQQRGLTFDEVLAQGEEFVDERAG